jgi:hypothetical protein
LCGRSTSWASPLSRELLSLSLRLFVSTACLAPVAVAARTCALVCKLRSQCLHLVAPQWLVVLLPHFGYCTVACTLHGL